MGLLPESEYNRLLKVVANGLANVELLTDFDNGFLTDFSTKFEKYKRHTFVSDAQEQQFDRIEEYLREELGYEYDR